MQGGTPVIYFKSLNQEFLVLGVERQFFYLGLGICLPIAFAARLLPLMDIIAALIFIVIYSLGILITRADKQMLVIYRRHIRYKKYYKCHADLKTTPPSITISVQFFRGKRGVI